MAMAQWDAIRAEAMICQSMPELIPQVFFAFLWESDYDRNEHAAIFEVKFGKKTKRATEASRERSAEQLFDDLESVASVVEGSDLGTSEDRFESTASCINDTKKRQLVTRSGLSRLRCCVCHLHHKWAMNSLAAVRDFFRNSASTGVSLQG